MTEAAVNPMLARALARRWELAGKFLRGEGVEIGALHEPRTVPARASVRYLDRLGQEDLRRQDPEFAGHPLVPFIFRRCAQTAFCTARCLTCAIV